MTEAEWLACYDPELLLKKARFRNHRRKSRLFAVACCRCIWPQFVDDRSRHAVEVAECHADGLATDEKLRSAMDDAHQAHQDVFAVLGKVGSTIEWAAEYAADPNPLHAANRVIWMSRCPRCLETRTPTNGPTEYQFTPCTLEKRTGPLSLLLGKWKVTSLPEPVPTGAGKPEQSALLRDIFGNPFRPATFDPAWRTSTAVTLAQQMYESRDFGAMPILADALQDAGCDNEDVLNHCRGNGPHVRGCWIVDLLLGKV